MGMLQDGTWTSETAVAPTDDTGQFQRAESGFRGWLTADGRDGPDGQPGFRAEADRYHLYVSLACPWAHRVLVVRALKGLDAVLPVTVVGPVMGEQGWSFTAEAGGTGDPVNGADHLHQVYALADPGMTGKVTVPVLWDTVGKTIVSNESADIIRMLNDAFDSLGARPGDYYPSALRPAIDAVNDRVYDQLNNGVYRAGFATSQAAYDEAVSGVFDTLDWLEAGLEGDWLVGDTLTEADIRLFTTLVRFDPVYHGHFKCNVRRLVDYPRLRALVRRIADLPGVGDTIDLDHIKTHYYRSHPDINPSGIIPLGPDTPF
ncbi:glutathionyl-hydroquinone reductase YqjG [Sphingomonas sp. Leaf17]|uniref:glutathione S-transferase family protein n=1 Tax=Sphingomonas sp. Leaf17 TaxID=1735683 RepID=UPI0006F8AE19|nr:glutathione S-transferase family protein [Sphingomonas sp. Leaf17]KQM64263.1 glutathionyl-hydroquinone reductase YqjG [Sphingomonas sp. Leaf17]